MGLGGKRKGEKDLLNKIKQFANECFVAAMFF